MRAASAGERLANSSNHNASADSKAIRTGGEGLHAASRPVRKSEKLLAGAIHFVFCRLCLERHRAAAGAGVAACTEISRLGRAHNEDTFFASCDLYTDFITDDCSVGIARGNLRALALARLWNFSAGLGFMGRRLGKESGTELYSRHFSRLDSVRHPPAEPAAMVAVFLACGSSDFVLRYFSDADGD